MQYAMFLLSIKHQQNSKQGNSRFGSEDLNDLRSRALLLSNSMKREQSEEGTKKLKSDMQKFVTAVDIAHEICSTISDLYSLGHFSFKAYSRTIRCNDNQVIQDKLSELRDSLVRTLDMWIQLLSQSRNDFRSLNYLFSDQLSLVSNYLTGFCEENDIPKLQNLLYFVHPGSSINNLKEFKKPESELRTTDSFKLELMGGALDQIMTNAKFERKIFPSHKDFVKKSKDMNAVIPLGSLYIVQLETESTQTIPVLLSLYCNTVNVFPVPSEVIFCHEATSWEEINLLILRCIISAKRNESSLFCICNVEKLQSLLQYQLVEKLTELLTVHGNLPYRLALICRGGLHHPIIDHFSSHVHQLQGFDTGLMQDCLQKTWKEVNMVTSSVPGLGKTEHIKQAAFEKRCVVKTVSISGPFSREMLVSRLQEQKLRSVDLLHIDISEIDDAHFLDACLFEYIFLGCFCSGTKVACLPSKYISIEVANTVQNYLVDSLIVLSSFKRKYLHWDIDNFIVSNEILSPIQTVCHYLKALEEGTLDSVDVNLGITCLGITQVISPVECRNLMQKYFSSLPDLSYTVTEIFLNVFSDQLKKLSASHYFTVKNLQLMLGNKHDVRSQLVKAFMEVAKDFACRSVQSCRSLQNQTQIEEIKISSEQHVKKPGFAEILTKRVEGMLHWADTNHLLVTFNGTDSQTITVLYRDLSKVPQKIKELFQSQLKNELPDFHVLSQTDLYRILEKITKSEFNQQQTLMMHNQTYALTPDNILKMILILQRIRANVPVVIMGDTGCGKTSLIRYLANECETKFEHFCIHAGITIDKISEVVMQLNISCLEDPKHQVWLFFDEINTCDHIGLINEIICHHKFFGKNLANNLIFLAACNPYKLRESRQITTSGLDGKVKLDKFSKLVYRVHPLPESIIDYVWDYGTLHQKDEISYIERMAGTIFEHADPKWRLKDKIINVLAASQKFLREIEGNDWCVSVFEMLTDAYC